MSLQDKKKILYYFFAYTGIPVAVNALFAFFSQSLLAVILLNSEEIYKMGLVFQSTDLFMTAFSISSFLFPTAFAYYYGFPFLRYLYLSDGSSNKPSDKIKSVFMNLPLVSSIVSFIGWAIAMSGTYLYFYKYNISFVGISNVKFILFNLLTANLCAVIIYYLLDLTNRRMIRMILVEENLSKIKNTILISIRSRFFIFYIAIAITPCIFLIEFILSILVDHQLSGYYPQLVIFSIIILVFGIALTYMVADSFARPIRELQTATSELQSGNLNAKVSVDSNDEIGYLGERFNEMSLSIKEKEFIKDTFGKVVDPTVRDYLLKGNLALGGETKDVSVLFVDIRGFTTISEKLPPSEVVNWLNLYFEQMSECIAAEKGLVNKFIGDAILAVFGAPIPLANHAESAVRAGIEMRAQAKRLSEAFLLKGLPELKIGIGIHSGKVLAGNIGSLSRLEYTVIGDTVNIASRLEAHCKVVGKDLLLTESTKALIGDLFSFESIGKIQVRGRESEIGIYSV